MKDWIPGSLSHTMNDEMIFWLKDFFSLGLGLLQCFFLYLAVIFKLCSKVMCEWVCVLRHISHSLPSEQMPWAPHSHTARTHTYCTPESENCHNTISQTCNTYFMINTTQKYAHTVYFQVKYLLYRHWGWCQYKLLDLSMFTFISGNLPCISRHFLQSSEI